MTDPKKPDFGQFIPAKYEHVAVGHADATGRPAWCGGAMVWDPNIGRDRRTTCGRPVYARNGYAMGLCGACSDIEREERIASKVRQAPERDVASARRGRI